MERALTIALALIELSFGIIHTWKNLKKDLFIFRLSCSEVRYSFGDQLVIGLLRHGSSLFPISSSLRLLTCLGPISLITEGTLGFRNDLLVLIVVLF